MRGVGDQGVVAWQPSRDGLTCAARRHCPSGPSPIAVVRAGCTRVAGRTGSLTARRTAPLAPRGGYQRPSDASHHPDRRDSVLIPVPSIPASACPSISAGPGRHRPGAERIVLRPLAGSQPSALTPACVCTPITPARALLALKPCTPSLSVAPASPLAPGTPGVESRAVGPVISSPWVGGGPVGVHRCGVASGEGLLWAGPLLR